MPIDATEFDEYLHFANELADAAAGAILPHFRATGGARNKSAHGFDPVTGMQETKVTLCQISAA